ncbi:hypothetical protein Tco_1461902 [Tanacetum coccineum]
MSCTVESTSLEPNFGNKFISGGQDIWICLVDFSTGEETDGLAMFSLDVLLTGLGLVIVDSGVGCSG